MKLNRKLLLAMGAIIWTSLAAFAQVNDPYADDVYVTRKQAKQEEARRKALEREESEAYQSEGDEYYDYDEEAYPQVSDKEIDAYNRRGTKAYDGRKAKRDTIVEEKSIIKKNKKRLGKYSGRIKRFYDADAISISGADEVIVTSNGYYDYDYAYDENYYDDGTTSVNLYISAYDPWMNPFSYYPWYTNYWYPRPYYWYSSWAHAWPGYWGGFWGYSYYTGWGYPGYYGWGNSYHIHYHNHNYNTYPKGQRTGAFFANNTVASDGRVISGRNVGGRYTGAEKQNKSGLQQMGSSTAGRINKMQSAEIGSNKNKPGRILQKATLNNNSGNNSIGKSQLQSIQQNRMNRVNTPRMERQQSPRMQEQRPSRIQQQEQSPRQMQQAPRRIEQSTPQRSFNSSPTRSSSPSRSMGTSPAGRSGSGGRRM